MLRVLVAAGGTGGGVYPALAVVGALDARSEHIDVLWIGGEGGMETTLVERAGIPFKTIPAAGVHGVGLRTLPGNLLRLARGTRAARRILDEYKPDVLFFTGGYVGVPVAYAGRHLPQAMFVPDLEPALALRWISRWAKAILVTSEEARSYYSAEDSVEVVGYPTRQELAPMPVGEARQRMGLESDEPTLLVFGGSRGARSINFALWESLEELLREMQVIHITGRLDWPQVEDRIAELPATLAKRYQAHAYIHDDMAAVFSAADLVLSRAGAATLGEYPLFALPAILVPYPHAWRYQKVNADFLVSKDAAVLLPDDELTNRLPQVVLMLMRDEPKRLGMREAMQRLHQEHAADKIAAMLEKLAAPGEATRG